MSEQRNVDASTGGQPASRPGVFSWVVAGAALVALVVFMIAY
jgi:hypothetical protein